MNNNNLQAYIDKGGFGTLDDIGKIKPLAMNQGASVYTLELSPAESWYKPKALSGILFFVLISGQILLRISDEEGTTQFMREDSVRFIDATENFSLESLYGKAKLLICQLPSEASYADSVQIDLRYFSNSKENQHVSKKMDEHKPFYN